MEPAINISLFCQLGMSMNRYFAICYDGKYFHRTIKLSYLQLVVALLAPYAFYHGIVWLTALAPIVAAYVEIFLITLFISILVSLDWITFYKHHGRQSKTRKQAERRLAIQMVGNNFQFVLHYYFVIFAMVLIVPLNWTVFQFLNMVDKLIMNALAQFWGGVTKY
ncbi:unnamed protein product, partial [Mesorhabditis belari]|uniref:Uncharacterized protein n=1 Tax=Mesorhabditis belari TaxID=2138241 RepID=A0AAF3FJD5_9BILA